VGRRKKTGAIAPPKTTGGGGFTFENDVAAFFLALLLADAKPWGSSLGGISVVAFQKGVDGWHLDDIVVTLKTEHTQDRLAISVKDRPVLDERSLLADVVRDCWSDFLGIDGSSFVEGHDLLGLVIPLTPAFSELEGLITLALETPGEDLAVRITTVGFASQRKRDLWNDFKCPDDLQEGPPLSVGRTADLLRHLRVVCLDLNRPSSLAAAQALSLCQDTLESGSATEAALLWDALRAIANRVRPAAGSFDRSSLVAELSSKFSLHSAKHVRSDWQRLAAYSERTIAAIPHQIGGRVEFARSALRQELVTTMLSTRAVVLLGASGAGKSVLAKQYANTVGKAAPTLWLSASVFDTPDFSTIEARWQLRRPINLVLAEAVTSRALAVVDGVDRLSSKGAIANLRVFLQALSLNDSNSHWTILLTCQPDQWARLHADVVGEGLPNSWSVLIIPELTNDDLEQVWQEFPQLARLRFHRHLRRVLHTPKTLDVLANGIVAGLALEATDWVGESDLVKWYWENVVARGPDGPGRSLLLQQLGELQADSLKSETPVTAFGVSDVNPLSGLVRDGICTVLDERIRYIHDLYGDWARQRRLLSHGSEFLNYLKDRSASPAWNSAVRLMGVHLLEQNETVDQWQQAIRHRFTDADAKPDLVRDLLLDSLIIASDSGLLLEKVWATLKSEEGVLLRRFLLRFLHVATVPNPLVLEVARLIDEAPTLAATQERLPYWPYWLPTLSFVYAHRSEVIELAPLEIAHICEKWLRFAPATYPFRHEAAEIALDMAVSCRRFKQAGGWYSGEERLDAIVYRAALAAARDLPSEVKAFALEAAGRSTTGSVKIDST
jgi:hypothetical protein